MRKRWCPRGRRRTPSELKLLATTVAQFETDATFFQQRREQHVVGAGPCSWPNTGRHNRAFAIRDMTPPKFPDSRHDPSEIPVLLRLARPGALVPVGLLRKRPARFTAKERRAARLSLRPAPGSRRGFEPRRGRSRTSPASRPGRRLG